EDGENGSNSEVKSSVMMPVKCAATCAEVKTQNFARAEVWSPRVTSLRSHRLRLAPANGATSADCGNRLMKSGTIRVAPTHGQNISTLPVSPSPLDRDDCLPKVCDGFCALVGLKPDAARWSPTQTVQFEPAINPGVPVPAGLPVVPGMFAGTPLVGSRFTMLGNRYIPS